MSLPSRDFERVGNRAERAQISRHETGAIRRNSLILRRHTLIPSYSAGRCRGAHKFGAIGRGLGGFVKFPCVNWAEIPMSNPRITPFPHAQTTLIGPSRICPVPRKPRISSICGVRVPATKSEVRQCAGAPLKRKTVYGGESNDET